MSYDLHTLFAQFPQPGRVEWIGVRPHKRTPMIPVESARLDAGLGLLDDHYAGRTGKRHLTLIQAEHLRVLAGLLYREVVEPGDLRRNVVVSGLNLLALNQRRFRLGECELEYTGLCHPCSRMEKQLGAGGYNAVRGHGGITARVVRGGVFSVGDELFVCSGD